MSHFWDTTVLCVCTKRSGTNTFTDTFSKKLLMLLDDVKQFFLWVVAAMLDGRRIGFDWLNPVWENKREWLNVTKQFRSIHHLMSEVEQSIAHHARVNLSLSMSIPFKCGRQAPMSRSWAHWFQFFRFLQTSSDARWA